jgi:uroporphyrinogen-III decarboxylase
VKNEIIDRLLDQYLALADGARNRDLLGKTWLRPNLAYMDDIGVPQPGVVPILAVPQISMWARSMNRRISDLFTDPVTYLEVFLRREIDRFTLIEDDRPLNRSFLVLLGSGFEASLFGAHQVYSDTEDPFIDRFPILQEPKDLDRLGPPDFHVSGLMPLAHRFYHELSELVEHSGVKIAFADWNRGPFGVAVQLRGMEQFLVDLLERPDFARRLLEFLTQSAIHYRKERASFLGIALDRPVFHNDDVNVPGLSPGLYRELALPFEKQYAQAFGGLLYWHSCGDVTPMVAAIREIPNITIFHCGPWTDVSRAAEVFGECTLDTCVHIMDVYDSDREAIRSKVRRIAQECREHGARSFSIRPGILQAYSSPEEDLQAISRWVKAAKEAVSEDLRQL